MQESFSPTTLLAEAIAEDAGLDDSAWSKLAAFVTVEDAARVAQAPLGAVLAAASCEPFSAVRGPGPTEPPAGALAELEPGTTRFDVRPILSEGGEPFGEIMRAARRVPEGGALILDVPFDPAPLRRVLRSRGFADEAECLGADHWRVVFRRCAAGPDPPARTEGGALVWRNGDGLHIDVRGLEPPQPMIEILRLVEAGSADAIVVHHEREPLYLYPELAEREWRHAIIPGESGEVRLLLTRAAER